MRNNKNTDSPLRQLFQYMSPFHVKVKLATLFSVLNKLFDLAPPILIGAAVDVVVRLHVALRPAADVGELH